MKTVALAAAAALVGIAAPASAATIVQNDFNSGAGGFTLSGNTYLANGALYAPCCGTDPTNTNTFVAFGGGNQPSGTASTSFLTVIGSVYTVMFNYATLGGGSDPLTVTAGGITQSPFSANATNNPIVFQTGTFQFTATTRTSTLSFTSAGTNNADAIIDNVSVTGAVPEPATWAMMLLGFSMVGFGLRSRRAGKVATRIAYA